MRVFRAARFLVALVPWIAAAHVLAPARADGAERLSFVALGDMPYNLPEDDARFESLIDEINRRAPAFTIHVGDTQSSRTPCGPEMLEKAERQMARFAQPLIYTPGDNEWTDCHLNPPPHNDPVGQLADIRRRFFADDQSLGRKRLVLFRQSTDARFSAYVENARWEAGGVVFATVHVVGSNNNLQRDRAALLEYDARNAANLAWIAATFAHAKTRDAKAVVLAMQADTMFEKFPFERTGFNDTLAALIQAADNWSRPILVIQGDTHRYRVDQPLYDWPRKMRFPNLTRLVVPGADLIQAVIVEFVPDDADAPFAFRLLAPKTN